MTQSKSKRLFAVMLCMFVMIAMMMPVFGAKAEAASKKIHLSQTTAWLITGESVQLKLIDAKDKTISASKVTWSTSNKKIAKVSKKGKVTAIEDSFGGECKITAKYKGKKYTCKIKAYEFAEESDVLTLSYKSDEANFTVGNHEGFGGWGDISLTVKYDGKKITDWRAVVDDKTLGTVSKTSKGLLKVKNIVEGETEITLYYQDKCATIPWRTTYACSKNITVGSGDWIVQAEAINGGFGTGDLISNWPVNYKGKVTKNYTVKVIDGTATVKKLKNGQLQIKCIENGDTRFEITSNEESAVFRFHMEGVPENYWDAVIKWGNYDITDGGHFGQIVDNMLDVYINGEKNTNFEVKSNNANLVAENVNGKLHLQAPEGIGDMEFVISLGGKHATFHATSEGA